LPPTGPSKDKTVDLVTDGFEHFVHAIGNAIAIVTFVIPGAKPVLSQ
jgi:hypothetical protein